MNAQLTQKRLVSSGPRAIHFAVSVLLNAYALRKWQLSMIESMKSYTTKVRKSIDQIFTAGAKLLVQANLPTLHRLMKKLVQEKDRCDTALTLAGAYIDRLIEQVMRCNGDHSALKQKVLDQLQVMRTPALPDINFIYKAVRKQAPSRTMRRPFHM